MANRWNIPAWLEREVAERDVACVYCGAQFAKQGEERRSRPSWEHIVNDLRIITLANIALCCIGCNSSKGAKDIEVWLASSYCLQRGIPRDSVAPVVRLAIMQRPSLGDTGA